MLAHKFRGKLHLRATQTEHSSLAVDSDRGSFPYRFLRFAFSRRLSRSTPRSSLISQSLRLDSSLARPSRFFARKANTQFRLSFPVHTQAFGDHCAAASFPIIPMQTEFKEVNSEANVFTPFYLNPRRFRMYCQFCIYTLPPPFSPPRHP